MSDRAQAVTLSDVANMAGVSVATASRVLNGTRTVREAHRTRVLDAAAELRYSANAHAQAIAKGHTNVIGLVVADIGDPYFSAIAAGVMRAAEERGLIVTLASTLRRPEKELEYLAALRGQRARAVILAGSRTADSAAQAKLLAELQALESAGGRAAAISQDRLPVDTVVPLNRAGANTLAHELVSLGYRRFGALAGPADLLTARDRLAGFREGLAEAGVDLRGEHIVAGEFTRDGGYQAAEQLLSGDPDISCLFAVNDVMAVGAMAALRDHGVRLPDDMAVAGFDDIATLRDVTPPLTTVRLPLEDLGASAFELVMSEPAARRRLRRVEGEVVIRASTPAR
jgi:LacI family transcriptional regulator